MVVGYKNEFLWLKIQSSPYGKPQGITETVQQYNVLYNYLLDFQYNLAEKTGLANCYGTTNSNSVTYARTGLPIASVATGNSQYTVCMPVL